MTENDGNLGNGVNPIEQWYRRQTESYPQTGKSLNLMGIHSHLGASVWSYFTNQDPETKKTHPWNWLRMEYVMIPNAIQIPIPKGTESIKEKEQ